MAASPPVPRNFSHVSLYVPDVKAAAAFFVDECGLGIARPGYGREAAFLSTGANHHEIEIFSRPETRVSHLGIEYRSEADFLVVARSLEALGVPIQRVTVVPDLMRSLFCLDPDGNGLHLFANLSRDWSSWQHGEAAVEEWRLDDVGTGSEVDNSIDHLDVIRGKAAQPVASFFTGGSIGSSCAEALAHFYSDVLGFTRQPHDLRLYGQRPGSFLAIVDRDDCWGLLDVSFVVAGAGVPVEKTGPCGLRIRLWGG